MPELSIIIVNYKNQELILGCVKSILEKETKIDFEIIVVDNHSEDDSEQVLKTIYPELKWIQMGYNSGFGRANNKGIEASIGNYLLLLNSDVLIQSKNTLFACLRKLQSLQNSSDTILGTRLTNSDGSYQETLRLSFPGIDREIRSNALYILIVNRLFKHSSKVKKKQQEAHYRSGNVTWINAAFLLMERASIIDKDQFFDPDFFLYGEDMEWCWRARKRGMSFYHWHEQELVHIGSASSTNKKKRYQQIMASDWLYLKKTRGLFYAFLTMTVVWNNQLLDSALHLFAKLRRKQFSEAELHEKDHRKWTYQNLKRFFFPILFSKKLSNEKNFTVNCYKD